MLPVGDIVNLVACWTANAANLGELRDCHDAKVTYEGDNNVLGQQASNWLLRQWGKSVAGEEVCSPLGTATFLVNAPKILTTRFTGTTVGEVTTHE
uniref:Uncharacterized protein n=2 Tax=Timema TaxID=61471 RepID=A0A7R9FYG0_TIMSH|nr:unnamed protein product [Timema shepardi]CAD7577345.1 unnamed protein product [Timema californicum]